LKQRHNKWEAMVRVPGPLQGAVGRRFLYRTLAAGDRRGAVAEAAHWELGLRTEWAAMAGGGGSDRAALRAIYDRARGQAGGGGLRAYGGPDDDPAQLGVALEIEKLEDAVGERELEPVESARLAGLQDALSDLSRQPVTPRRELEPTFTDLAADYV